MLRRMVHAHAGRVADALKRATDEIDQAPDVQLSYVIEQVKRAREQCTRLLVELAKEAAKHPLLYHEEVRHAKG